ncbi:MAG: hypothetical protein AAGA48_05400 [Myxococcota bacterium]
MWWWMAAAFAGPLPWAGDWALDPTQSDAGPEVIDRLVRGPITTGQNAAGLSPDPTSGQQTQQDDRLRLVSSLQHLLSRSGRILLAPADDGVVVKFAGEEPVTVPLGRKWTKVDWGKTRVRLRVEQGQNLVIERRAAGAIIRETFLPISEPGEVAVVIRIDGTGVTPQEFRRVYRAL